MDSATGTSAAPASAKSAGEFACAPYGPPPPPRQMPEKREMRTDAVCGVCGATLSEPRMGLKDLGWVRVSERKRNG